MVSKIWSSVFEHIGAVVASVVVVEVEVVVNVVVLAVVLEAVVFSSVIVVFENVVVGGSVEFVGAIVVVFTINKENM